MSGELRPPRKMNPILISRLAFQGFKGPWSLENVRNLVREITSEIMEQQSKDGDIEEDLRDLANAIYAFHMENNDECKAIDLALEAGEIDLIDGYVKCTNYKKAGSYLSNIARYLKEEVRVEALKTLYEIYFSFEDWPRALQIALFLDNLEAVGDLFSPHHDLLIQKQLCYIIARQGITFVLDETMTENDEDRKVLQGIINNGHLSEGYRTLALARDVDGKSHEDIFKAQLLPQRGKAGPSLESSLLTLATTFANAFWNAGCGKDNLMTVPPEASGSWVFKDYEHRKASAAASLGMVLMWNVDSGLAQLDKYLQSDDNHVIAGALLGVGILTSNVKLDPHPPLLLLGDSVKNEDSSIRIAAILGLGLAYAGSHCPQIRSKLSPILRPLNQASKATIEVIAFTALALGLVYVGSCDKDIAEELSFAISWQTESDLEKPFGRVLVLGIGLLYLGNEESEDAILEASGSLNVNRTFKNYFDTTLLSCAFAGSGNVHQVHHFLRYCSPHLESGGYQAPAVIGIAMVAMGNDLGIKMSIRLFHHLLSYGAVNIRRAVPLALSLLCISNPEVNVMNTLSRLSHDEDEEVAMAAIISLGLIGAGTNNAKIAGMLRSLSQLSDISETALFCIQVAQGLVHLGKGLLTMAPYHSGHFLLSRTALAGIITVLHACLDMKSFISGNYQFLLYFLALAMQPSMLMMVDENLKPVSVPVRVGKVVDLATVADQSNTITHWTPVVLAAGERAELATEKYIPLSHILEGYVILKENPDYFDNK